ncbi:MAG TPA: hypothetical protein VJL80_14040, partial [Aeromicrobium sp.]
MIAALLTVGAPPAKAALSPEDADCRDSADPVAAAESLLDDIYAFGVWPARKLSTDLTWTENPFNDDNWQSHLHALRWATNLLQAELSEKSGIYGNRLYEILADWESTNPRPGAPSSWAWSDHTTAGRALVLVCV